mmetsp:Transcript_6365/g.24016  ORF Transcript_6365/g.24016 Transcript_6365/m.24016 type:complete len:250 (+) Transcript_6365:1230-1979(+)
MWSGTKSPTVRLENGGAGAPTVARQTSSSSEPAFGNRQVREKSPTASVASDTGPRAVVIQWWPWPLQLARSRFESLEPFESFEPPESPPILSVRNRHLRLGTSSMVTKASYASLDALIFPFFPSSPRNEKLARFNSKNKPTPMAFVRASLHDQSLRNRSSAASALSELATETMDCFSSTESTSRNVSSNSAMFGVAALFSFPRCRRRACPGAATSTPTIATGSDTNTTKSPSCETLKLKLGALGRICCG